MENLYTVEKLFSQRLFRIPDYQRGYAWETQQCQEFLEDLELLEADKQHFMGTLILHARSGGDGRIVDRSGSSYTEYDIVDGQQRLTTILILLQAMGQMMAAQADTEDLAQGIKEKYLVTQDRNRQPLAKLALNEDSRAFFRQVILEQGAHIGGPTIRSHKRLLEAKAYFGNYLAQQQEELGTAFGGWLEALFFTIIQRLTLMVYIVEREADAGIIFETMNNRGKPITELEKAKNYLLYLAGKLQLPGEHELVASVNQTWKHIFESLMAAGLSSTDNEDQLLRAHWLMVYDPQTRNWEGSRSIKRRFNLRDYRGRHESLLAGLQAYLSSLHNAATAYCDIFRPTRAGAFQNFHGQPIRKQIVGEARRLARLGSLASFLPLLMAWRTQHSDDGAGYIKLLQLCEKYAFRVYRWLQLRSNAGQSGLFGLGYQLYQEQASIEQVYHRVARLILYYAPDSDFAARFESEKFNWYHWSGVKYFLYESESHLAAETGVPVKMPWEEVARKQDTIEHILPQTPDADGYWQDRFAPEAYTRWLNDIGNLTLTYQNPELRNRPFHDTATGGKKRFYQESVLLTERQITQYEDWTVESVQARREQLKQWALKHWHVDAPAVAEPQSPAEQPSADDYIGVLTRMPVTTGQKQLYKALYDAGDEGLATHELIRVMGRRDSSDLAGVLGALGRRVNGTPGYGRSASPGALRGRSALRRS